MQHLQNISANYYLLDDSTIASTLILIEKIFLAGKQKLIDWSIVDGFFPLLQFGLKNVRRDLFETKKVTT